MKIEKVIKDLYRKYSADLSGQVSTAIPALGQVDHDAFGISVVTINGDVINIGDHSEEYTIQSVSKPFSYGLALEQKGNDFIENKVGMEPTGEDFDSIIKMDEDGRPFNPMVNSGAIVATSLIQANEEESREKELLSYFSKFAGEELFINQNVYHSEASTAHKNWAIAHLLRHFKVLTKDYKEDLDLYFKQCSINVNTNKLAMMGATLANKGTNPVTKINCITEENLRHLLSVTFTCGMYNYSGEWAFDIGVPAKSGVSGSILMIVPDLMAIAVYSPRLDKRGNSVRGIKVCEELSNIFNLHLLSYATPSKVADIL